MRVTFHGAVTGVTGSCHLLETGGKRLLIDCGMFQGEQFCDERNLEPFAFDPKTIDAVFITHPHADHTGRLPKLVKEGFHGPIYFLEPAKALTKIVLEDAFNIMEDNHRRYGQPMGYAKVDLDSALAQSEITGYHHEIPVGEATVMFHDAGHILGSSYLTIKSEGKTIVFSGDIGNDDIPILPPTEPISQADFVVCESTYGHRKHESPTERHDKLKQAMVETVKQKGVLIIPAFSIERTQEILYYFNNILQTELHTTVPIFLDSPMAIRATQVYRDYQNYLRFDRPILSEPDRDFFSFPNLHETLTADESRAINPVPKPKIIVAGNGMMNGGRIIHHLRRYLPDPKSHVLIIGFQARRTLGRQIYEGASKVQILGETVRVRARVTAIGAFSAHGDMDKLTRWLQPEDKVMPKRIFLVHGDPEAKEVFAVHLRHELRTQVEIPALGQTIEL